ncbi:MAG: cupin domain-containing protein [Rhodococcus sp. (in: high G+C Gram-positive bacteria)]
MRIIFGGEPDGLSIAMITVDVPAGTAMPQHRHSGSDIIVMPIIGTVNIAQGNEVVVVETGDAVLVTQREAVSLTNPGTEFARLVIAAGPADFVVGISGWPVS